MWGDGVDELRLLLEDSTGAKRDLQSLRGVHQRNWLQANVTFDIPHSSAATWYTVVFEGVVGGDQQSDIAIDTFEASSSICRYQSSNDGKRSRKGQSLRKGHNITLGEIYVH